MLCIQKEHQNECDFFIFVNVKKGIQKVCLLRIFPFASLYKCVRVEFVVRCVKYLMNLYVFGLISQPIIFNFNDCHPILNLYLKKIEG